LGAGIYFTCLEVVLAALRQQGQATTLGQKSAWSSFVAGAVARMIAAVITNPITVIKTRFEGERVSRALAGFPARSATQRSQGVVSNLLIIARVERMRGLMSGLIPTLMRDAPFSGIYYTAYSQVRPRVHHVLRERLGVTAGAASTSSVLSAACAGVLATIVVHPADIVKTRLQMPAHAGGLRRSQRAARVLTAVKVVWQADGGAGFFVGVTPRILKRMPQQAITWTSYDFLTTKLLSHSQTSS